MRWHWLHKWSHWSEPGEMTAISIYGTPMSTTKQRKHCLICGKVRTRYI